MNSFQALFTRRRHYFIGVVAVAMGLSFTGDLLAQNDKRLRYKLHPGVKFEYEIEASAKLENRNESIIGNVEYRVEKINVAKNLSGELIEAPVQGLATSTAFGVTPDGYMLTCAHCVDGAEQIVVSTPEGDLKAKVIDTNEDLDLAIIKVESKELATIPLAKVSQVKLAQDVRAIGFPLSDVLGNSVKISRGAISGFVKNRFGDNYQIDVAVNPGNSGGPLVDDQGNVVGVVNAKLEGIAISKIGFAVPIRHACELLDKNNVGYDAKFLTRKMKGPELAQKVTPAVFFVKAKLGPDGYKSFKNFQVSASGFIERDGAKTTVRSRVIFNRNGDVIDIEDETAMPYILDPVCMLPFEHLPPTAMTKWAENQKISISLPAKPKSNSNRSDPRTPFDDPFLNRFGPGHFPRPFSPFERRKRKPELAREDVIGVRRLVYEIKGAASNVQQIERLENMEAGLDLQTYSDITLVTQKKLLFDNEKGIFIGCNLNGLVNLRVGSDKSRIPISLKYRLVGAETKPKKQLVQSVKLETAEKLLERLNAATNEPDENEQLRLLNKLAIVSVVDQHKAAVVKLLNVHAQSNSRQIRKATANALINWDIDTAIPLLVSELNSANRFSRRTWVLKLQESGRPEAAEALCEQLVKRPSDATIREACISMGRVAEPAVIETLKMHYFDKRVLQTCLQVLTSIGGDVAREEIQKLTKRSDWRPDETQIRLLNRILNK